MSFRGRGGGFRGRGGNNFFDFLIKFGKKYLIEI